MAKLIKFDTKQDQKCYRGKYFS